MIDIQAVRADTPACENLIHFNNAGCALAPQQVNASVLEHLQLEQEIGGYEAAELAADKLEGFYTSFATLLNCQPGEIAFQENATRAWHAAFHALGLKPGDHVITGDMEYASNYLDLMHYARRSGIEISVIPSDEQGQLDLDVMKSAIKAQTKLICLTHVASHRGDIQDAIAVGNIARENRLFYLLDACQSAGQVPLDVQQLQCDFLCGTGRKYLRGPRGTGFLFARQSVLKNLEPSVIDLQSARWLKTDEYSLQDDARRFENWERNVAACIGLATAVDYALDLGMSAVQERVQHLATILHGALARCPVVRVLERSRALSGIVTFYKQDEEAGSLRSRLLQHKINTSVSRLQNAQLDLPASAGVDVNRASVHYYNTEAEILSFVETLSGSI